MGLLKQPHFSSPAGACKGSLHIAEQLALQQVLGKVKESVDESNTVMGEFMCQGKMPQSVRDRYVKMKEKPDHAPNLDELIQNFDRALSHPDNEDLDRLEEIIRRDLKK